MREFPVPGYQTFWTNKRHRPHNNPTEDISDGLVGLGFDIIDVKQMIVTRRPLSDGSTIINLPLFLMTLPKTEKSQEIFRLPILCHIAKGVGAWSSEWTYAVP
jgi:hypothetical protein